MSGKLSFRDGAAMIIVIQISKIMVLGFPMGAKSDTWAAILLAAFGALPLMALYARLVRLMPGKSIFGMAERAVGRPIAVLICALYLYYFLVAAGITIGSFSQFVHLAFLPGTSYVTICAGFFIVCAYLAYSGVETLGKWSFIVLMFSAFVITASVLLSFAKMKMPGLILPMESGLPMIVSSGAKLLSIPFGEAIIFMSMAGDLDEKVNPYKLFIGASAVSGAVVLLIYLHNTSLLGQENMNTMYFPSYKAASVINIGTIGTRIEALIACSFIIEGITKAAAGIAATARAAAEILRVRHFRDIAWQIGLLCLAAATFAFSNVTEMFEHIDNVYPIYAAVFQLLIPAVIWVAAEVRKVGRAGQLPSK
ncbi:MAG: endospore germination permease [Oscillospiraceae bacterium]|nr:endospore germination permease [Oscillospiraceae bacterium]